MSSERWGPALAAAIAVLIGIGASFVDLGARFDLTEFLRVGEQSSARAFVEADVPDTELAPGWGHDGQANYVLAATFPHLGEAEGVVDSATYRARRIGYPALVSWVPRGMPLVVALYVANLLAIAGAAAAVAVIARRHGSTWVAGAAVGLSPAFLASLVIDLGDALALALAAAGVAFWRSDNRSGTSLALLAFTLAALTRETSLIIVVAVMAVEGRGRRVPLLVPVVVFFVWLAVLAVWLDDPDKSAAQFRPPFVGWVDQGLSSAEVALAFLLVVGSVWVAIRLEPIDPTWALVLLIDAAVLMCVDQVVLFDVRNLARVTPWVVPFAVLVVARGISQPLSTETTAAFVARRGGHPVGRQRHTGNGSNEGVIVRSCVARLLRSLRFSCSRPAARDRRVSRSAERAPSAPRRS